MGNKFPTHDAGIWSAAEWDDDDTNSKDEAQPGVGDAINFTPNSGNITLDANEVGGTLDMTGYTGTLEWGGFDLDIGGDVTLDGTMSSLGTPELYVGGNFVATAGMTFDRSVDINMDAATGAHTITTNGVSIDDILIDDGGGDATFTLTDALVNLGDLDIEDGDFSTGGFDVTTGGIYSDGGELALGSSTVYVDGEWLSGGATVTVNGADITVVDVFLLDGGSLTALGDFSTDLDGGDFEIDGGTLDLGSATWTMTNGDRFLHTAGTVTCTEDYSATIDAAGNTIGGITATNWITVINGVDSGGNTKLDFGAVPTINHIGPQGGRHAWTTVSVDPLGYQLTRAEDDRGHFIGVWKGKGAVWSPINDPDGNPLAEPTSTTAVST